MQDLNSEMPLPRSYRELLAKRHHEFFAGISTGKYEPFVYPFDSIGAFIMICCILIPHRNSVPVRYIRYFALLTIFYLCVSTIRRCRSLALGNGYWIGLTSMWCMLWSFAMIFVNDPERNFRRLEWTKLPSDLASNGSMSQSDRPVRSDVKALQGRARSTNAGAACKAESLDSSEDSSARAQAPSLTWQGYPESLKARLDWTIDLASSFRGPTWNWRIATLPPVPSAEARRPTKSPQVAQFLRMQLMMFVGCYLLLDLIKVAMMHDIYFWGYVYPAPTPPTYLPTIIAGSRILTKSYRLLLSLAGIVTALVWISTLGPLFFIGVLARYLPSLTHSPIGEPWLYPPQWGPFSTVLAHGLAGWWGQWWHQLFRFGISEPGRWIVQKAGWDRRALMSKIMQVMVSFALSGSLHACGSYTQFAETKPLTGPFAFFMLQGVGVLTQTFLARKIRPLTCKISPRVRQGGNLVVVLIWSYFTGPLLADDFARGGMWLFEPLPISFFRGLGFGAAGEGWWVWSRPWVGIWSASDGPWWAKGLAIW